MTKGVDTAFERHFSEPPVVAVSGTRTHCEACKEPLDPNVMHKCHGNQEYQAPVISSTEITEACPKCGGEGVLIPWGIIRGISHVVVCRICRVYVYPLVTDRSEAIFNWNRIAACGVSGEPSWAVWRADLPGDDERKLTFDVPESWARASIHPDLTSYKGACPKCSGSGIYTADLPCELCDGTGTIPPTKPEGAE